VPFGRAWRIRKDFQSLKCSSRSKLSERGRNTSRFPFPKEKGDLALKPSALFIDISIFSSVKSLTYVSTTSKVASLTTPPKEPLWIN
jgi:hypothetical protein